MGSITSTKAYHRETSPPHVYLSVRRGRESAFQRLLEEKEQLCGDAQHCEDGYGMGLGTAVDSGQPFLRALLMSAQDGTGWSAGPNEQEAGLASQRRRQDPSTAQSERGGQGCCGGRCEFRAETNGWARAEAEVLSRDEADSHNTSPLDRAGWGRIGTGQGSCEPVGVSVRGLARDKAVRMASPRKKTAAVLGLGWVVLSSQRPRLGAAAESGGGRRRGGGRRAAEDQINEQVRNKSHNGVGETGLSETGTPQTGHSNGHQLGGVGTWAMSGQAAAWLQDSLADEDEGMEAAVAGGRGARRTE